MSRPELFILIPCHGLEDFPTDLGETEAAGLLNAFAAVYHPALLAAARELPAWRRADDPPADLAGKIVVVPSCCSAWLPHRWSEEAREAGAAVVEGISGREELVSELLSALLTLEVRDPTAVLNAAAPAPEAPTSDVSVHSALRAPHSALDPALTVDFLAFGTCILQLDLLTRRMHYYSNLDGGPIRLEIVAAADAALSGDAEQARRRLSRAFELLLDARERFFPVDSYLIDLCLLTPPFADKLPATLSPLEPTTLLATAADWRQIADEAPELVARIRGDWEAGRVSLAGGEYREGPASLLGVESALWEFDRGLAAYRALFGRTPKIWARRRYGFSALLPQVLDRSGFTGALHAALDDGYYPDDELSKFRWEGCDGTGIDAFSRIPLAADSATSFLRFSQRMSESMEQDPAAAVMFARWPEVSTPWFEDLRRTNRYAPVFGKFVTLESFFENTDPPGRVHQHATKEYFAPYLTQATARGEPDPIHRFALAIQNRHQFEAAAWLRTIADLLTGRASDGELHALEDRLEQSSVESETETSLALAHFTDEAKRNLAKFLLSGAPPGHGLVIFNPLSFPRRVTVSLPGDFIPPNVGGPVKFIQTAGGLNEALVDLPAAGFVFLQPGSSDRSAPGRDEPPLAEGNVLRNESFEVHLSEATGGIAWIKGYGRSPKRLSQQLAYRFPRQRTISRGEDGEERSYYSAMRGTSMTVEVAGPTIGQISTAGEVFDQTNDEILARFRQMFRVTRGRAVLDVVTTIVPVRQPDGDPWSNYYASRFAWNDESAVLTRSVQETAQPAPDGRFDAPHYIEIAEEELRTTIIPVFTPFHRTTGERMLDSLLITAGETATKFRFVIACDEPYPLRPALDALVPPILVETDHGPPITGNAGWFLHVDAKNVQITSLRPLAATDDLPGGVRVRLLETEGRVAKVRLACFKTPSSARLVNFAGDVLANLAVAGDAVAIDLHRYEIANVELRF